MNIENLINKLSSNSHEINSEIKKTYQCDDIHAKEYIKLYLELCQNFKLHFPESKEITIVRAPGRVNLIGEHTDYNSLPVLPIAIEKNVVCISSVNSDSIVRLYNHDTNFEYREFDINKHKYPYKPGDWGNYVKAGLFWLETENKKGFNALFYGNIPVASGLSSSSALVVASALSFLEANKINLNKKELAEQLAKAEQYVGTMSGGMDHAISLLGNEGTALKIDFHPLSVETVTIPDSISFVVANSMIRAAKTENAKLKYNRRAIECRLVTAFINKFVSKEFNTRNDFLYIGNLKKEFPDIYPSAIDYLLNNVLNKDSFTTTDIVEALDISIRELKEKYLRMKDSYHEESFFHEPKDGFKLQQRFKYIVNESNRVDEAVKAMVSGNIKYFGELMNLSHKEARNLYEISIPDLDFLCNLSSANGALGARLTGAGFGGCIVSVIGNKKVSKVINILTKQYFHTYFKQRHTKLYSNNMDTTDKIFACKPCKGAGLLFTDYL